MALDKKLTKSDRTRASIETAARELFQAQGFDNTTIRQIAAAANTDASLVIRYFKNKDELFSRVAEPELRLPDISGVDRLGERLVAHFLDLWEGEEAGAGLAVLLRSAASNDYAADRLRRVFAEQVLPVITSAGPKENAMFRAGLVSAQLLGLALTRYILKLPPVVGMDRQFIIENVGETIQRYATLAGESRA